MNPELKDILYVSIQFLLFIAYLFRIVTIDFHVGVFVMYAGLIMSFAGIVLILVSLTSLNINRNLTPFPSPKPNGTLITSGPYKYIRHPIYTGILLVTAGFGIYSENTLRILVFIALLILFISKAAFEETMLIKKFPVYTDYKKKTAALLPGIY